MGDSVKRVGYAIIGLFVVLVAVGLLTGEDEDSPPPTASRTTPTPVAVSTAPDTRPGEPTVYASIAAQTDCQALQEAFDTAAANNDREEPGTRLFDVTLSYMRAADDRLAEVGCY